MGQVSLGILLRRAGKSPPAPGQPGIFALGGGGVLEKLYEGSGLTDVMSTTLRSPLNLASASAALQMMQQAFGAYRAVVADLGAAEQADAWREVHDFLSQLESHGRFQTELEFKITSGAR
jgi:hypothetical protein